MFIMLHNGLLSKCKITKIGYYDGVKPSCDRNRKLEISRAPTKAKSRGTGACPNRIDRQRVRSRESGRQTVRRLW